MSEFQSALRRVITGDNARCESVVIIDGGPSFEKGNPDRGKMFEIWEDAVFDTESQRRSRGQATRTRAAKGQFPSALVRNPPPTG
jgi:hypothetical protein